MEQRQKGEQFGSSTRRSGAEERSLPNRVRLGILAVVLSLGLAVGASFPPSASVRLPFGRRPPRLQQRAGAAGIPAIVTGRDVLRRQRRGAWPWSRWCSPWPWLVGSSYVIAHSNEYSCHS